MKHSSTHASTPAESPMHPPVSLAGGSGIAPDRDNGSVACRTDSWPSQWDQNSTFWACKDGAYNLWWLREQEHRKFLRCRPVHIPSPDVLVHTKAGRQHRAFNGPSMPNWFKLYETDLNESRLQWAMGTNHECAIVLIYLMSRCCTERSDTIKWNRDLDFMTMASTLKISCPLANDALRLLEHVEYIRLESGTLKLLTWASHQDAYLHRLEYFKKYNKTRTRSHSVHAVNTQRRGDQSKQKSELPESNDCRPPHLSKALKEACKKEAVSDD